MIRHQSSSSLAHLALAVVPLVVSTVAACSTAAQSPPVDRSAGALCVGDRLGQFAGRAADAELGRQIQSASGASALRWVPEGTMVTMEFRGERVTVHLDRNNRVERAVCG